MKFICFDGEMVSDDKPTLMHDNRSFRYGDGLFETMKMINGKILLKNFHFERLFKSLSLLEYKIPSTFTTHLLEQSVAILAEKNQCSELCRVRLTIFRGNGFLYPVPGDISYIIECNPLNKIVNSWNEQGVTIDIYPEALKSCDRFSNIKSANFLPYVLGAMHAQKNKLDDCVLMNTNGNIADTTIASIFLVHGKNIYTPALSEGCINGVMRRYLLEEFQKHGYSCEERKISAADLESADELFLTNSIIGIRWVKKFADKEYASIFTRKLCKEFIEPIFA